MVYLEFYGIGQNMEIDVKAQREKTRVQRINDAIFYLHTTEGMPIRQIQHELRIRLIELSLTEIMTIIASFNFKVVKERAPKKASQKKTIFRRCISPLIRVARKQGIINRSIWEYFEYRDIQAPNSDYLDKVRFDNLILSLAFKEYPKQGTQVYKPLDYMILLYDNELSQNEKNELDAWIMGDYN